MVIELTWKLAGGIVGVLAAIGGGMGVVAYYSIKSYRHRIGIDKSESDSQTQEIIRNYKELYESNIHRDAMLREKI